MCNGCFIVRTLFAGRPTACEMGVLSFYSDNNFVCWQAHCM